MPGPRIRKPAVRKKSTPKGRTSATMSTSLSRGKEKIHVQTKVQVTKPASARKKAATKKTPAKKTRAPQKPATPTRPRKSDTKQTHGPFLPDLPRGTKMLHAGKIPKFVPGKEPTGKGIPGLLERGVLAHNIGNEKFTRGRARVPVDAEAASLRAKRAQLAKRREAYEILGPRKGLSFFWRRSMAKLEGQIRLTDAKINALEEMGNEVEKSSKLFHRMMKAKSQHEARVVRSELQKRMPQIQTRFMDALTRFEKSRGGKNMAHYVPRFKESLHDIRSHIPRGLKTGERAFEFEVFYRLMNEAAREPKGNKMVEAVEWMIALRQAVGLPYPNPQ